MRRLLSRNSENKYKKLEEFLTFSLKDVTKESTFDFFLPKLIVSQYSGFHVRFASAFNLGNHRDALTKGSEIGMHEAMDKS
ncbi:hypothetical protein C5167_025666 [Papaver somniferum]|uniref:Uncharacterized protein n=1 Tax=Papaver somniferum TaxID=3469 RepID=A0A4Y7JVX5_PAPSO|nr:hypothetical protein C5167_025666 [Papaver somniferum]